MKESKIKNSLFSIPANSGFTLLESLVAIAIFTTGVSTAVLLVIQSIQVGDRIQKRIVAAHLAQEGMEVVRNIRDSNWLAGRSWIADIDTVGQAGCVVYNSPSIDTSCPLGRYLAFSTSSNHYLLSTETTPFYRTASTTLVAPDKLLVEVNTTCGNNCNVKLEEYLYDWK